MSERGQNEEERGPCKRPSPTTPPRTACLPLPGHRSLLAVLACLCLLTSPSLLSSLECGFHPHHSSPCGSYLQTAPKVHSGPMPETQRTVLSSHLVLSDLSETANPVDRHSFWNRNSQLLLLTAHSLGFPSASLSVPLRPLSRLPLGRLPLHTGNSPQLIPDPLLPDLHSLSPGNVSHTHGFNCRLYTDPS